MSSIVTKASLAMACLSVGLVGQAMGAAISPSNPTYTTTFNSAADVTEFTAHPGTNDDTGNVDTWAVGAGGWQHNSQSVYGGGNGGSQVMQATGVSGNNFTVSTLLTVTDRTSPGGTTWTTALALLSSNATQGLWTSDTFYNVGLTFTESGAVDNLAITSSRLRPDWGPVILGSQDLASQVVVGGQYTLAVTGTYGAGGLTLDAVLKQGGAVLASAQGTDPSPMGGDYFGLSGGGGWGAGAGISYQNYTISTAVPEPASLGLLGLGVMGLMARRRKLA